MEKSRQLAKGGGKKKKNQQQTTTKPSARGFENAEGPDTI